MKKADNKNKRGDLEKPREQLRLGTAGSNGDGMRVHHGEHEDAPEAFRLDVLFLPMTGFVLETVG